MANTNKATIFVSVALLLLSLVVIHDAESRVLPKSKSFGALNKAEAALVCAETYGAEAGDTCFTITNSFNLTTEFFSAINPNLDCDKIFVAQWLCIDGFAI